jgi:DtxR family transcriptional regulator, Mn-dependent transcriptional regulator
MHPTDDRAEEILEQLWKLGVEEGQPSVALARLGADGEEDPSLGELAQRGWIRVAGGEARLTDEGLPQAQGTVRRHRLAERLLADVLDVKGHLAEESACRFEHLLQPGLEERICTLLGHPTSCPHGLPIPPGECCREGRRSDLRLVCPLAELRSGQEGTVAYLHSREADRIQKLMAMGVSPAADIRLLRRFPSYVFQVGHSQFAVDEAMARSIYVRL